MRGMLPIFIDMPIFWAAAGVFGYVSQKRKRSADEARRFLIWYAISWPFLITLLFGLAYPRLHWLYYVAIGIALLGNLGNLVSMRSARRKRQVEKDSWL
jgi:hypothetical protein